MEHNEIKTRSDGSIDTQYYMNQSRTIRSEAAHNYIGGLAGLLKKTLSKVANLASKAFTASNGSPKLGTAPAE